ncbi:valacyclovir hydrolase-like isoform X2 [Daktulosphaira vitifoliae]|uniref:valacyclovir hydrolase-like isoform X2 n=2 Tax=Daktulosphaira vitifoliae TaxID=58002 RepID=UPI0021AA2F8E|nr:valacyclovir hydrolase-like isoform X2 [Daktulosphaira vitifoliae]
MENQQMDYFKTIELNVNGKIFHSIYRKIGTGPQIILLIGGTYGEVKAKEFQTITDELVTKGLYTFIETDLPGFGVCRPPDRDYSPGFIERDAKYLIVFMETLNINKYSVMGWCYGGTVALHIASLVPNRVLKVVEWGARTKINEKDINLTKKFTNHAAWRPEIIKTLFDRCGVEYFNKVWDGLCKAYRYIYENNNGFFITMDQLQRIRVPVLLIYGTADGYVGDHHVNYVHNNLNYSKLVKIVNAHHEMHKTHYEKFCRVVNEFYTSEFTDTNKTEVEI